jgi:predicted PurR-regulated permease PerM
LPFVLVFLGAVGGILTFGFIGLFLGPTLLAIGYSLLNEWSASAVATGTPPLSSCALPTSWRPGESLLSSRATRF